MIKFCLYFLLPVFVLSCSSNKIRQPFIPKEYKIPEQRLEKGVTMVNVDNSANNYQYTDIFYHTVGDKKYLVYRNYDDTETVDSTIVIDNRLHEMYTSLLFEPQLSKGEILLDTIADNGKKLGKQLAKIRFANESAVIITSAEEEFEKDTVFTWQQKQLPTLVVKSRFFVEIKFQNGKDTSFNVQIWTFYAKGVGVVRSRILNEKDNKLVDFDLVEIKDRISPPQN